MVDEIKFELANVAVPENVKKLQRFFKTKPGEYSEGDIFIGVSVPEQRKIAGRYANDATVFSIQELLHSEIHEHRLTALFMLVHRYKKAKNISERQILFELYNTNTQHINNWDLVDSSAHHIAGAFAYETGTEILFELAECDCLWRNRIAMVATYYFIKKQQVDIVFELARVFLSHKHDLMHKAVGWMLREAGKVSYDRLYGFLRDYYAEIPRTSLRYAIEKFPNEERLRVLRGEFLH